MVQMLCLDRRLRDVRVLIEVPKTGLELAYANYLRILGIGTQHPIPMDPYFWMVKLL